MANQIPKLSDICRRNKTTTNKVVLKNVRNPFGIFLVGFLAANSLHIFWVCKDNFARCLKDVVNGNPVFAGGLHADIFTVVGTKPICAQSQVLCEGGKTPTLVSRYAALIRGCNAGNKKRLVNIHSTANRVNNFKHSSSPQNKD